MVILCLFHFNSYKNIDKMYELTFFRQDSDPISVKREDFKVPQVSNISWNVFNQITSQNLQEQEEKTSLSSCHY